MDCRQNTLTSHEGARKKQLSWAVCGQAHTAISGTRNTSNTPHHTDNTYVWAYEICPSQEITGTLLSNLFLSSLLHGVTAIIREVVFSCLFLPKRWNAKGPAGIPIVECGLAGRVRWHHNKGKRKYFLRSGCTLLSNIFGGHLFVKSHLFSLDHNNILETDLFVLK